MEQALILIKPDGVQRGLMGEIIQRFERRGLQIVGMKFLQVSQELAEAHYAVHQGRPFYTGLIQYITSGPVVAIAIAGKNAIAICRHTIGATKPTEAACGSIRGDFAVEIGRNLVHGSDSPVNGAAEVALWFSPAELVSWQRPASEWVFE